MQSQRELAYLGEDRLLLAFLRAYFPNLDTTWYPDLPSGSWERWDRIVVIDAGPESVEMLLALREINAGVPAIVLVGREHLHLTQACTAYRGGAEAVFCKPLCRPKELVKCVIDCDRRLDHWKTHLLQSSPGIPTDHASPSDGTAEDHHLNQMRMIDELCMRIIGRQLMVTASGKTKSPIASRYLYPMRS